MRNTFIQKLKKAKNYNPEAIYALGEKLATGGKIIVVLNLIINVIYKWKQKQQLYLPEAKLGYTEKDFIATIKKTNLELFPNNILIVAELSIAQCTKYRVTQKYAMLKYLNKTVNIVSWNDTHKVRLAIQTAGTVIFYRVPAYDNVIMYFKLSKYLGVRTYFDIDDLIFDEKLLRENTSLAKLPKQILNRVFEGATLYREAMCLADCGIASTTTLARQMEIVTGKKVHIVNNAIDQLSIVASNSPLKTVSDRIRIVYGSGSSTHDADFFECALAIYKVLIAYSNVDFVIYGHLTLDKNFEDVDKQIFRVPFISANDYYKAIGTCDIAIAPLEKNVFNDCKSNIKFIESAMMQVPCICSPRTEFVSAIKHGVNGFLANNDAEWYHALVTLIEDKELRNRISHQAYLDVVYDYHWQKVAQNQLINVVSTSTQKKKRVLIVNILFKPDSFGGATIIAENTAKILNESNELEPLIFCGTFDSTLQPYQIIRYETDGIPVVKIKLHGVSPESNYHNMEIKDVFKNIVAAWCPDLVHFHSIQELGASLAEVCINEKIPYIVTLHDAWWFCERQFMIRTNNKFCSNYEGNLLICAKCITDAAFNHRRRFYLKEILDQAVTLLTPSEFQRGLYISAGFDKSKIKVNKNGVRPVVKMYGKNKKPDGKINFAYLGGKAIHKGYYWLCDIFSQINLDNYTLKLVNIESRMGIKGINVDDFTSKLSGKIEVVPYFDQDMIDEFFKEIDVLLFPSQGKESFGLTIREALLRNVWVISTDCGGPVEDIIDGINGNVVPFDNDPKAFKTAIVNILQNPSMIWNYNNPHKAQIRLIEEQVSELIHMYKSSIIEVKEDETVIT